MTFYRKFIFVVVLSLFSFLFYQRYFAIKYHNQNRVHEATLDTFQPHGYTNEVRNESLEVESNEVDYHYNIKKQEDILSEAVVDVKTLDLLDHVENRMRKGENLELNFDTVDDNLPGIIHVIVVPHSHNDPGWLRTPENYFEEYTQYILDGLLEKLIEHPQMTFVWAETVFLSMWWTKLTEEQKKIFNLLIESGRLEIVGGGWVVPDEAVTHYTSLILNFLEGHQWLKNKIANEPKVTWSLDPFGYSSFFPYLYNRIGLKSSIILRVNTHIKKELEMKQMLHFRWRQNWDKEGIHDVETFMLPFMLYNIKHQCGPDPDICLKFDFRMIAGEPSESKAQEVNSYNIIHLAESLVEQFKKKASLQKIKNVVLIPLGDDFRYDKIIEWDQQYNNYMKLFNYINKTPKLGVRVKFGVVSDFFEMMAKQNKKYIDQRHDNLFSLSGDFFPYTDKDNDYWTGFYTTRIWLKKLIRILEYILNVAEVIHVRALLHANRIGYDWTRYNKKVEILLMKARQTVSLMQHHDAITGTSTSFVTKHYKKVISEAIRAAEHSAQKSMHILFSYPQVSNDFFSDLISANFKFDMITEDVSDQIWSGNNIILSDSAVNLVTFNSALHHFKGILSFRAELSSQGVDIITNLFSKSSKQNVRLILKRYNLHGNKEGEFISACQVHNFQNSQGRLVISFTDHVPPLSFALYQLSLADRNLKNVTTCDALHYQSPNSSNTGPIKLENDCMKALFDSTTGHLLGFELADKKYFKVAVKFFIYDASKDGAYIFGTLTKAREFEPKTANRIYQTAGSVRKSLKVHMDDLFVVDYHLPTTECDPNVNDIYVDVSVNMTDNLYNNIDLIMRMTTELKTNKYLYTDSNGFSTILRKRLPSLPVEANYYPATSYVFIQSYDKKNNLNIKYNGTKMHKAATDDKKDELPSFANHRFTLLMKEPRGVSSQYSGSLEVMLDRKSVYNDGRGMGEGIIDNMPVTSSFHLLLEKVKRSNSKRSYSDANIKTDVVDEDKKLFRHPTLLAIHNLQALRNRPSIFMSSLSLEYLLNSISHIKPFYKNYSFPCDLTMAFLRHIPSKSSSVNTNLAASALLVLHRYAAELSYIPPSMQCNLSYGFDKKSGNQLYNDCKSFSVRNLFPGDNLISAKKSSLTMFHIDKLNINVNRSLCLNASSLHSYVIQFGQMHL